METGEIERDTYVQSFRTFFQIDSLPALYPMMIADFKYSGRFGITHFLFDDSFHHHLFKFSCVSFVRLSLRHEKCTPCQSL